MFRKITNWRYILVLCCLLLSPICIYGQDLGSSNDLFRKKTTNTKKRSTTKKKRSASRKKNTTPKKKNPTDNTDTAKNTSEETSKDEKIIKIEKAVKDSESISIENKSETSEKIAENSKPDNNEIIDKKADGEKVAVEPRNKIIIKVGEPTTGNFADLFEKAIIEGNEKRNVRDYAGAEDAYLRAESLKTGDFRSVYGLGNLYSDQERWEESETAYKKAISLNPDEPSTYLALSYVLTQPLPGKDLLKRYAEAETMTLRAIDLDANNSLAYDRLGVALELQGVITDRTLNAYKKAIELNPTAALAYAHLGRLLRKRGEIRESSKAYLNAIQLSVDVPMMILVADVMQSQQRYLESEQLLRRALREDSKHPTALFLLGRALTVRGNYEEAEEILKKSAEVSPNSFVSYQLLSSLYSRQEKFAEAEKFLQKALKVISPNEEKRLSIEFEAIGDGYMRNNKSTDAARAYNQAFLLDKERGELSTKLAKAQGN